MDLSVVILSYNVRYLLESCIESVLSATRNIHCEVLVIDNNSVDDSVHMLTTQFPALKIFPLKENVGFSKAYNIAIRQATGEYVLVLNPDTIVNQNALENSLKLLKSDAGTGAVGVRMIDGEGKYLKESKRGKLNLSTSIFKITGFNQLFPHSPFFNQYYLGHLNENETHEIETLTGAYMMMPRSLYVSIGGFDERFFMYGEDIDLSNRITSAGKKLMYLGNESIIHLKGRSAKSDSYTHVRNFYTAMSAFVIKNYQSRISRYLLQFFIGIAGTLSFIKRKVIRHYIPIFDALLTGFSIWAAKSIWARWWFQDVSYFDNRIFAFNSMGYLLIWMLSLIFFQTYQNNLIRKLDNNLKAIWSGALMIVFMYSFLPEHLRSSRSVIVLSNLILSILLPLFRRKLIDHDAGKRVLFIGDEKKEKSFNAFFKKMAFANKYSFIKSVRGSRDILKTIHQYGINLIVFDKSEMNRDQLLASFKHITSAVDIQSMYIENQEVIITKRSLNLSSRQNQFLKWAMNTMCRIVLVPFGLFNKEIRKNWFELLVGKKYFVGYQLPINENLPYSKTGIWTIKDEYGIVDPQDLNYIYARDFSVSNELRIILNNLF